MKLKNILVIMLVCLTFQANGQQVNRFSINAGGGMTWGHTGVESGLNHVYGGGLELSTSSLLSFRLDYQMGLLGSNSNDNHGRDFENEFYMAGLGVNLYMRELLGFRAGMINPLASFTAGMIQSDLTHLGEHPESRNYEEMDSYVTLGGGFRFRLGRRIDLLTMVDLTYPFTNYIDGFHTTDYALGNDFFSTYQIGLALKLGSAPEHIIWHEKDDVSAKKDMEEEMHKFRAEQKKREEENAKEKEELKELVETMREEMDRRLEELNKEQESIRQSAEEAERRRPDATTRERDGETRPGATRGRDGGGTPFSTAKPGNYHIIVGAFQYPSNAENLHKKYTNQGHSPKIILNKRTGLHFVALETHTDLVRARQRVEEVRNNLEGDAWLYFVE